MLDIIWLIFILFLIIISFYIGKKINFNNFNIPFLLRNVKDGNKSGMFMALATKMGVGSIISVTIAICIGGIGSIFWMILFGIISTPLIYYESILGSKYKEKYKDTYISGPYFYIKKGLNKKLIATISALLLIISYSFIFQMIQTNTINEIIKYSFNINPFVILIVLISIILPIMFFNMKEIISSVNKLVPFMCILVIIVSLITIILNYSLVLSIIKDVIKSAFNIKTFLISFIVGVKKSIFLSELLIGTTSITAGVGDTNIKKEASFQTLGIYFINIIITFLVSLLILIFLSKNSYNFSNYNLFLVMVFNNLYGNIGNLFLILIISLFAITTILSGYYIGLEFVSIVFKNRNAILIFKVLMLLSLLSGLYFESLILWKIVDLFLIVLIFINIYCIIKLSKEVNYD